MKRIKRQIFEAEFLAEDKSFSEEFLFCLFVCLFVLLTLKERSFDGFGPRQIGEWGWDGGVGGVGLVYAYAVPLRMGVRPKPVIQAVKRLLGKMAPQL